MWGICWLHRQDGRGDGGRGTRESSANLAWSCPNPKRTWSIRANMLLKEKTATCIVRVQKLEIRIAILVTSWISTPSDPLKKESSWHLWLTKSNGDQHFWLDNSFKIIFKKTHPMHHSHAKLEVEIAILVTSWISTPVDPLKRESFVARFFLCYKEQRFLCKTFFF